MKPEFLFMCKITDEKSKKRMEKYVKIIEVEKTDLNSVMDNAVGKEGIIVPYTAHKLITKEVMDSCKELKIVGTTYGGTRQNIDDEYAIGKGLTVIHTGASRPRPMAEYALGLILSSLMYIHNYNHYMKSGEEWPRFKYGRSRNLSNRRVGVIGLGLIGKEIVNLLKCFTSDISVHSNHLSKDDEQNLGVKNVSLNQIFADCEIIILSGGYNSSTYHMIGKEQFEIMNKDALFVNIARGKMVNQKEMIDALDEKEIYLALDVFEEEPLEEDSPLRNSDRVLLTPHRANNSIEFEQRWDCLADEIELFYTGKTPKSKLSIERARAMSNS